MEGKMSTTDKTARFQGKVALVTGAASGIGKATAIHFSTMGAQLVITDKNADGLQQTVDECKANGVEVLSVIADLTVEADVERLMSESIIKFSHLDVLVNCAGIGEIESIETGNLAQYDRIMNINLRAVYHLTMLAVPHLIASKGAIVNVSSVMGVRSFPGMLSYCMSKSAVDQFTRCVALELAPKQVRVNSVCPGVIKTNLFKSYGMTEEQYNEVLETIEKKHPLGRYGEPEEVAKAIAFLASDEASFTTGAQLPVDAGWSLMCPR